MKKQTRHQHFSKGGRGNELTSEMKIKKQLLLTQKDLYHKVGLRNERDNNKLLKYL